MPGSRPACQEFGCRRDPVTLRSPCRLSPCHAADEIGQDVGDKGGGEAPFGFAQGPVGERGAGRGDGRRRVRHVVGHDLIGVDTAAGTYGGTGRVDDLLGQVDGIAGRVKAGGTGLRHGIAPYRFGA